MKITQQGTPISDDSGVVRARLTLQDLPKGSVFRFLTGNDTVYLKKVSGYTNLTTGRDHDDRYDYNKKEQPVILYVDAYLELGERVESHKGDPIPTEPDEEEL